jgi:hypothetical protein
MARYRIYYLKESQRMHFRSAPPAPGPLKLKRKDYEEGGQVEAPTPYVAWKELREIGEPRPIEVGDALELDTGALLVCRWQGFEEASWYLPEAPVALPAPNGHEVRSESRPG